MIKFKFNKEKFISLIIYFAKNISGLDKLKAVKLIYFADRECLLKTGRPILGDEYIRMDMGPVPSKSFDLLREIQDSNSNDNSLSVKDPLIKYPIFISSDDADLEEFTRVELDCIKSVIKQYGKLSGNKLSQITHSHRVWIDSSRNRTIDYQLFFKDNPSENRESFEAMMLEQKDRDFIDNL